LRHLHRLDQGTRNKAWNPQRQQDADGNAAGQQANDGHVKYSAFVIFNHIFTPYFIAACARPACVRGTFGALKSEF
jgi:hypothetical protein